MAKAIPQFVIRLHQALSNGNINEIGTLYERGYTSLSNEFYKAEEWPRAEVIASLVRNGESLLACRLACCLCGNRRGLLDFLSVSKAIAL